MKKPDYIPAERIEQFLDANEIRIKRWRDPANIEAGIKTFIDYPDVNDNAFIHEYYSRIRGFLETLTDESGEYLIPFTLMDELPFFNLIYEQIEIIFNNVTDSESIINNLRELNLEYRERFMLYISLDYIITTLNGSPTKEYDDHILQNVSNDLRWCHKLIIDEFNELVWACDPFNEIILDTDFSRYSHYKPGYARDLERRLKSTIEENAIPVFKEHLFRPKVLRLSNLQYHSFEPVKKISKNNKEKLSHSQIALVHFYNKESITFSNSSEIALNNGWDAPTSGLKILRLYTYYSKKSNRLVGGTNNKSKEHKEELFRSIESLLKSDAAKIWLRADLAVIINNNNRL